MTWGTPGIAAIVAGIAVPALVILYFLKLRRRTVEVSTTLLWRQAIQDLQANAPFQKLRRNILLLLQLLVLGAALFAVAQPRVESDQAVGERHIILIDRSASMAATDDDGGRTRLERAKAAATDIVENLREGTLFRRERADEAMVIAFDASSEIVSQFSSDKVALKAAIDSIRQTDAPSAIGEAFRLAQAQRPTRVITDNAGGQTAGDPMEVEGLVGGVPHVFHLLSDGRLSGVEKVRPESQDQFLYYAVGEPDAVNVGITGLRAERGYEDPVELTVFVGLQSTDTERRTVDVELLLDGAPAAIKEVALPPASPDGGAEAAPATSGVVFQLGQPGGTLVGVRLRTDAADALLADNEGYLVVPPARQTGVAVVTRGNLFISEALSGMPLSVLDTFTPEEFEAARAAGDVDRYDVVVLDGWLPPPDAGGRSLPPGRWLVMNAVPGPPLGVDDAGPAGPTAIIDWSRVHPVLRDVTLDPLRIGRSRLVTVPAESTAITLAESDLGPAILELSSADVRAIMVPFDVAETNWPFDVGFVVFLASAIDYLGKDATAAAELGGASRQFRPGHVLTARLPQSAADVRLLPPGGLDRVPLVPAPDGAVVFGPLRQRGVYEIAWRGPAGPTDVTEGTRVSRFYAANLLNPEESAIGARSTLGLANVVVQAAGVGSTTTIRNYWPHLLLAALAVMMIEWFVYNKKVHV